MALVLHELARHLRDLQTSDLTVRAALLLLIAVVVGIVAGLLAIEASADKAAA
jgi:hypothetical protein